MKSLNYIMTTVLLSTLSLSMTTLAAHTTPAASTTAATSINRIVAIVNSGIITQLDLDRAVTTAREQFQQRGITLPPEKAFRQKILEGLIFQKLQLQLAKQNEMKASDKEVNAVIANIAKQNHITEAQFKEKLREQKIDFKKFKKQIADQIIINNLQQQVISGKVQITQPELDAFKKEIVKKNLVEEYHIIDYLITLPDNPTAEQKQQALQTAEQVKKALEKNETLPVTVTTTDMGWQTLDKIPDAFAVHVVNMPDGSITDPLLTGNGYHIVKLEGSKKEARDITDDQARQLLIQKKSQKILNDWLKQLKSNAYVKIFE